MKKSQQFDPKQWVKARQACSISIPTGNKTADGVPVFEDHTFSTTSQPVKASHPAVRSNPDLFEAIDPDNEPPTSPAAG